MSTHIIVSSLSYIDGVNLKLSYLKKKKSNLSINLELCNLF